MIWTQQLVFTFYAIFIALCAIAGAYASKTGTILNWINGGAIGSMVCLILYNVYKNRIVTS